MCLQWLCVRQSGSVSRMSLGNTTNPTKRAPSALQVVERRVYTVTGQRMPEEEIDRMIENGAPTWCPPPLPPHPTPPTPHHAAVTGALLLTA